MHVYGLRQEILKPSKAQTLENSKETPSIDSKYMALKALDDSDKNQHANILFNLATSGDSKAFTQALAFHANANQTTADNNNNPNWIYLSTIPNPKDGEAEKKKVKGKWACYCDFHKAWSFWKQHASATCNSKKKNDADSSEVTLQATLAAIAGSNEGECPHIRMHVFYHDIECEYYSSQDTYADFEFSVS